MFTIRSDWMISPRAERAHDVYVIDCVSWVGLIAVTPDGQPVGRAPEVLRQG